MMKMFKKFLIGISAFIFLIALSTLSLFIVKDKVKKEDLPVLQIGSHKFEVEIADSALEQSRGLSGRASLAENRGMLFVFNKEAIRSFWMVGMNFPLDIIWIKGDRAAGFSENLPPAGALNPQIYYSPEPVDKVLEINAGLVKKLGIKAGDLVVIQ